MDIYFFFTKDKDIEKLTERLQKDSHKVKKVILSKQVESEDFSCLEDTLSITDSAKLSCLFAEKRIPTIVYLTENNRAQNFGGIKYAVEELDAIDEDYLQSVYKRYRGIPKNIMETKRCLIREITVDDVDVLYQIYREPTITDYMESLYPTVEEEKEYTRQYIKNIYGFYEYGMWIIEEKISGNIIGRAGLEQREGKEGTELGYMIAKPYQRNGFAFEVCSAILRYAMVKLGITAIYSFIEKENISSIQLSKKLGFSLEEEKIENGKNYLCYIYQKQ